MCRFALAAACVLGLTAEVLANGRPPQTSSITFRPGAETEIAAGMSFGLLLSKDSGATWRWMCEDALPYGGMYDPDYEYMTSGTLFATTFDGLKVNRDGCVFGDTVLDPAGADIKFFSVIARGSDNTFYAAAADPTDGAIYKSTNDGTTFTPLTPVGMLNDWFQSLEVAPSNAQRIYLSGYRFVPVPDAGNKKEFFLFTSDDGGASWDPLPLTAFTTMSNSTLEIASVSKTNPLHVFVRVKLDDNAIASSIYESTNGGQTWNKILTKQGEITLLIRRSGELVAGTTNQGTFRRAANAATPTSWDELTNAPHINCLVENSAGEVWACTQNYGIPGIPMDGFGIMKTTDLVTWTGVLKYQDIYEPVACGPETLQYSKCDRPPATGGPLGWCGLCAQLGCDPKRNCMIEPDGAPPPKEKGCCSAGDNSTGPVALGFSTVVGIVLLRRRRRR